MQAEGFSWIGRGHELAVDLPPLIVQAGNCTLKIRHLLANLALGPPDIAVQRLRRFAPTGGRLAKALGLLTLAFVDFFVDRIEISLVIAAIVRHMTIADF